MNLMKNLDRRNFLNQSCPLLMSSLIGVVLLKSCSKEDLLDTSSIEEGYTISGKNLIIDLKHSNFSALDNKGWMNFKSQNLLILKKSKTEYKAFSNRCPHEGFRNQWTYSESKASFLCKVHNNSYNTDCETKGNSGVLSCFSTQLSNTSLTITLS